MRNLEDKINQLLELFPIDEILEMCDITEEETLTILVVGGHIKLPPFISHSTEELDHVGFDDDEFIEAFDEDA